MAGRNSSREIYTVVEVWRGIASRVRTFASLERAQGYMRRVRAQHNLLEDDVQVFKTSVPVATK